MATLMSLKPSGRALVDEDFLAGVRAGVDATDAHLESPGRPINLDGVDQVVTHCLENFAAFDTKMDQYAAVELHKALRLTPREAGDVGVWHYLAVVHAPQFVRHRWEPNKGFVSGERFLGNVVRNSFARLWWGAELTVLNQNYADTQLLFTKSQDLYEAMFGRTFSRYPDAVRAFLKVVGSESEDTFRRAGKDFTHVLTTVVLEGQAQKEIESLLEDMMARIKAVPPPAPTGTPNQRRKRGKLVSR